MKQYYAERAKEHDKVYLKPERQENIEILHKYLKETFLDLNVLEIACGTGYWTKTISEVANSIMSIDYNNEVLDIARLREYKVPTVSLIQDDAYDLSKIKNEYSAGFAGFFWSHIPLNRIDKFLAGFHSKFQPDAKVIFIDNLFVEGSSTPILRTDEKGNTFQIRNLENGSEFEVLKNFPSEEFLEDILKKYSDNIKIKLLDYYWIAEYILNKK